MFTAVQLVAAISRKQFEVNYFKAEGHDIEAAKNGEGHVHEEVTMIKMSDATVYPWTMMIHFQHTPV